MSIILYFSLLFFCYVYFILFVLLISVLLLLASQKIEYYFYEYPDRTLYEQQANEAVQMSTIQWIIFFHIAGNLVHFLYQIWPLGHLLFPVSVCANSTSRILVLSSFCTLNSNIYCNNTSIS